MMTLKKTCSAGCLTKNTLLDGDGISIKGVAGLIAGLEDIPLKNHIVMTSKQIAQPY
jgi:hypothetical protein